MLLGELRRRVDVARVRGGVLGDEPRLQRGAARGAQRLEPARVERGDRARPRPYGSVARARVASLAVDDHRPGEHELADAAPGHRGHEHGGAEVVAPDVLGRVPHSVAEPHHGRLVAHGVDPGERPGDGVRVAHVVRRVGARVEHDGFVPARRERFDDVGPDEPGTAGDQYAHAPTLGGTAPRGGGPGGDVSTS
ncbi:hypothetical protein GA0115252_12322 [Streptomyces sp. DfronAA-171]|nr:hypothetical protein GA0115252_12322 [Streptomyces sp. DfronAA-171]